MNIFFINLAAQPARRQFVEDNFAQVRREGWHLNRIEAVTAAATRNITGNISDTEKACFLSHRRAIEAAQHMSGPVLIAEDDVLFGQTSLIAIESALAGMSEKNWDILFTDLVIPLAAPMADFFLLRQRLAQSGQLILVELGNLPFGGSTAYVVNGGAKEKLGHALAACAFLDLPYDLQLRQWVRERILCAYVAMPFLTTVSAFADMSQVQEANLADTVWTAFRRLIWLERDSGAATRLLGAMRADPAADAFARILTAMQSPAYTEK